MKLMCKLHELDATLQLQAVGGGACPTATRLCNCKLNFQPRRWKMSAAKEIQVAVAVAAAAAAAALLDFRAAFKCKSLGRLCELTIWTPLLLLRQGLEQGQLPGISALPDSGQR